MIVLKLFKYKGVITLMSLRGFLVVTIACCFMVIYFLGCNQKKELSLTEIEKLMFANFTSVSSIEGFPGEFKPLGNEQIIILRSAIRNGIDLSEIENEDVPDSEQVGNIEFQIDKSDHTVISLVYSRQNNFCYISKIDVNYKNEDEYRRQMILVNKYLKGIYKFRPSREIEKLLIFE